MGEHEGPRDWRHIYKTRIRTSTAVLLVAFIVCSVVYGYTSQRYAAPETGTTSRVVNTTPREREYTEPSTTRSSSSSVPSSSSSEESSEPSVSAPGGSGSPSGSPTSTTHHWLDDVPIPGIGTTTTTAPPST
ncbi:hypothetical protein GYA93_21445 [Gordonia desulfuricans]|uniref:Uncharacterized protein n=1 Tax=Gordonia desulfuricans TaxID=89051 RepID=A0A7K3LUZ1_9ACTN|nr:hypothetical protein [Gordonia desulfuricans]NDK92110.1 hypothetical protein [Gordonia desulfuricans]